MSGKLKHFFTQPQPMRQARPHLAAWVRAPFKIGALTPSSKSLARAMAAQIDLSIEGMVIELGAGTGAVTYALAEKVPHDRLIVVERDPRLYTILHQRFPDLKIVRADALDLAEVVEECAIGNVCAVVSSLPLLSMPRGIRQTIESRMAALLAHGGRIIQFTYGPTSPIPHDHWRSLRLWGKRRQFIVSNVPPAHVWVYQRDRRIKRRD